MTEQNPILLTGAGGQVGFEVQRLAREKGCPLIALTRAQLDIGDAVAAETIIAQVQPGLVINGAAYTAVDKAEQEIEAARRANRQGPANLAAACHARGIPLLHLSTDYVFDGTRPGPTGKTIPSPSGVYGQSKWEGEEAVRAGIARHLIIRVSWSSGHMA